jgi:hypothetical protein
VPSIKLTPRGRRSLSRDPAALARGVLQYLVLLAPGWVFAWPVCLAAAEASIEIRDDNPFHVHEPDEPFSISVRLTNASWGSVRYHWQDDQGLDLSWPRSVRSDVWQTIRSPARAPGYYGLVFETTAPDLALPGRTLGEAREYGFAVLYWPTPEQSELNQSSVFGVVHADPNDPYLGGWSKTTTWEMARGDQAVGPMNAAEWLSHTVHARDKGLEELPIITGAPWTSDDASPIAAGQLESIRSLAREYFSADARAQYWEVGIEENLSPEYAKAFYWSNLAAKMRAVREAANQVDPGIRLIYQVAGLDIEAAQRFAASDAAQFFDILSLHPYAWPDFPDPETWLEDYVGAVRQHLQSNGIGNMPIWFTEVGAPHHGNHPGGFFGYPSTGAQVEGLSRPEEARFLVKVHTLALQIGVEKIFWYNYQDWGDRREYAEDHFGLRDYEGFPKPAYAAYYTLRQLVDGKRPTQLSRLPNNVTVARFAGDAEDVLVAWRYAPIPLSDATEPLAWSELYPGLTAHEVATVIDVVGTPYEQADVDGVLVGAEPLFIVVTNDVDE